MKKITFKEYLDSKDKLLSALKESPVRIATYTIKKYCKIPVGESKNEKQYVALKPKNNVIVEWKYDDVDAPLPLSIQFDNVKNVSDEKHNTFWTSERLQKWLIRNTKEGL